MGCLRRVYFVSETAQVALKSGRVYPPASNADKDETCIHFVAVHFSPRTTGQPACRGLHSSTSQLNMSRL